ncbi:arad-like aldolase/epimerase [Zalerion maritima]|uniref:Arad-like aldolase/epimerase n=1 Tax=Zalerion maritima TaxID=339359 RepID=A0AAD5RW20_9PEZI|nr:arad-like aldolase/epimerase [Zalerion maritima]
MDDCYITSSQDLWQDAQSQLRDVFSGNNCREPSRGFVQREIKLADPSNDGELQRRSPNACTPPFASGQRFKPDLGVISTSRYEEVSEPRRDQSQECMGMGTCGYSWDSPPEKIVSVPLDDPFAPSLAGDDGGDDRDVKKGSPTLQALTTRDEFTDERNNYEHNTHSPYDPSGSHQTISSSPYYPSGDPSDDPSVYTLPIPSEPLSDPYRACLSTTDDGDHDPQEATLLFAAMAHGSGEVYKEGGLHATSTFNNSYSPPSPNTKTANNVGQFQSGCPSSHYSLHPHLAADNRNTNVMAPRDQEQYRLAGGPGPGTSSISSIGRRSNFKPRHFDDKEHLEAYANHMKSNYDDIQSGQEYQQEQLRRQLQHQQPNQAQLSLRPPQHRRGQGESYGHGHGQDHGYGHGGGGGGSYRANDDNSPRCNGGGGGAGGNDDGFSLHVPKKRGRTTKHLQNDVPGWDAEMYDSPPFLWKQQQEAKKNEGAGGFNNSNTTYNLGDGIVPEVFFPNEGGAPLSQQEHHWQEQGGYQYQCEAQYEVQGQGYGPGGGSPSFGYGSYGGGGDCGNNGSDGNGFDRPSTRGYGDEESSWNYSASGWGAGPGPTFSSVGYGTGHEDPSAAGGDSFHPPGRESRAECIVETQASASYFSTSALEPEPVDGYPPCVTLGQRRAEERFKKPKEQIARAIEIPQKQEYIDSIAERKSRKIKLALVLRILSKNGVRDGLCGFATMTDPVEPDTFWTNPLGVAWSIITAADLIRVGKEGNILDGGRSGAVLNVPASVVHPAVYAARPSMVCTVHAHIPHGTAFATQKKNLKTTHQDACIFHNDLSYLPYHDGMIATPEQGKVIARFLTSTKGIVLRHHGIMTAGDSIESALYWFLTLDRCCQVQLAGYGANGAFGSSRYSRSGTWRGGHSSYGIVSDDTAESVHEQLGSESAGYFMGLVTLSAMRKEAGTRICGGE